MMNKPVNKRLAVEVLRQAIEDSMYNEQQDTRPGRNDYQTSYRKLGRKRNSYGARAWLRGRYVGILDVEQCCAVLGFDYDAMLKNLEAMWKES